jgi:hypothetical protein
MNKRSLEMKEVLLDVADDIHALGSDFEPYASFVDLELQAAHATHYENSLLPAPLQNWTVSREMINAYHPAIADEDRETLLDTRSKRAAHYADGCLHSTFFIPEAVLDIAPLDPRSWTIQLRHLINMASAPHTSVRIVPKDCFTTAENKTTLLDMPDGKLVAYLGSTLRGDELSTDDSLVEKVVHMFRDLGSVALDEASSIGLVLQRIKS